MLAKYISKIIEIGLDNVRDNGGDLSAQVELVNKIVTTIMTETKEAAPHAWQPPAVEVSENSHDRRSIYRV